MLEAKDVTKSFRSGDGTVTAPQHGQLADLHAHVPFVWPALL
jgi:hypothetical protein